MAEFQWRFDRAAEGIWLPETAVDDRVLAILAEEGVGFTILAPNQSAEPIDTGQPHRWLCTTRRGAALMSCFMTARYRTQLRSSWAASRARPFLIASRREKGMAADW